MTRRELVEVIGMEAAEKLCEYLGGCTVYVPLHPLPATERALLVDNGQSAVEVARMAGVGSRTVRRARWKLRKRA